MKERFVSIERGKVRNVNHETKYFGPLRNDLPMTLLKGGILTTVFTQTGGNRAEIVLHKDFDSPCVNDYYNSITKTEAQARIKEML